MNLKCVVAPDVQPRRGAPLPPSGETGTDGRFVWSRHQRVEVPAGRAPTIPTVADLASSPTTPILRREFRPRGRGKAKAKAKAKARSAAGRLMARCQQAQRRERGFLEQESRNRGGRKTA